MPNAIINAVIAFSVQEHAGQMIQNQIQSRAGITVESQLAAAAPGNVTIIGIDAIQLLPCSAAYPEMLRATAPTQQGKVIASDQMTALR